VYDGRTHELSYHKKNKKKAVLVLLLVLLVCMSEELRVGTWTSSKVGLQPRRSMSMSHTHIVCLVGRVTIERESWQYRNTRALWMQENNNNNNNNILSLSLSLSLSLRPQYLHSAERETCCIESLSKMIE